MKAIRLFFGNDTYGRGIEVAQGADMSWFSRVREFNGYAVAWSRWQEYKPEWVTETENQYTGERSTVEEGRIMAWGFQRLKECAKENMPRLRLPG